jgi:CheY-like chemotaxis protein
MEQALDVGRLTPVILVEEPSSDVHGLLEHFLRRLGFKPVSYRPGEPFPDADAILLEPASPRATALLAARGRLAPASPVICISIYPRELAHEPAGVVAHLVKPFTAAALETALQAALERH